MKHSHHLCGVLADIESTGYNENVKKTCESEARASICLARLSRMWSMRAFALVGKRQHHARTTTMQDIATTSYVNAYAAENVVANMLLHQMWP